MFDFKMNRNKVKCHMCNSPMDELTTMVRERTGCTANCSGKMIQKIIAYKCKNCDNIIKL